MNKEFYTRTTCRICDGQKLEPVVSLGSQAIAEWNGQAPVRVPLEVIRCLDCDLLQLRHTTNPFLLWNENYGYRSGVNQTMRDHLKGIANQTEKEAGLKRGDIAIDIGCNDGTLLKNYSSGIVRVGFEPSPNVGTYAVKDQSVDCLFGEFFNADSFVRQFGEHSAKAITAISMFYDLDDPNRFVYDLKRCLTPDGVIVVQQNYVGGMIAQNAVDNICHEHLEYYCLHTMQNLLKRHGLEVYRVEENNLNGGSFRTFIANKGVRETERSVSEMISKENFDYDGFAQRSKDNATKLHDFVKDETGKGKRIYIYGASTRGNTLVQFAQIEGMCQKALERNPDKWGKEYNGAIMVSEEEGRRDNPDFFLILPWFFLNEFLNREKEYLDGGGHFIVPLPTFRII